MIQRIQSVYLIIAFFLNGGVFFNALYHQAMIDPQPWVGTTFAVLLTLAALLPLVSVFLYGNRQNQIRLITAALLLQVLTLGFGIGIYISLGGLGTFLWNETIGLALLALALVSELLARKKIRGDIELVKSMDRIR